MNNPWINGALSALGQIFSALSGNWLYALIGLAIVAAAWQVACR